jgi:polyisoprenoid-binding protein YceI
MRRVLTLVTVLLVGSPIGAVAAPRRIEFGPPTSEVSFRAYGFGMVPIDANFARFDGWLTYDPDNPASCKVELRVHVASLTTEDVSLRSTMVGPDFMDAASFPALTYVGACDAQGLGGTLAMHGVTKPLGLSLTWTGEGVVAAGRLARAEWGMTAMPLVAGRTIRIRVAVPLPGTAQNAAK